MERSPLSMSNFGVALTLNLAPSVIRAFIELEFWSFFQLVKQLGEQFIRCCALCRKVLPSATGSGLNATSVLGKVSLIWRNEKGKSRPIMKNGFRVRTAFYVVVFDMALPNCCIGFYLLNQATRMIAFGLVLQLLGNL